jgi:nucleotide-binding universal stress UspA family protein
MPVMPWSQAGSRINFKYRHSFAEQEVEPMIHRVLVPTEFSERSERLLRFARENFPDVQIHVIYALDRVARGYGITEACFEMRFEGVTTLPEERELIKRFDTDLRDRLERFVRNAIRADQVTSSYLFGDVVTVILETAQRWQADLTCMATHEYRGLECMDAIGRKFGIKESDSDRTQREQSVELQAVTPEMDLAQRRTNVVK